MSGAPLFPLAQRVHGPGARAGRPVPSLPSCRGLAGGQRSRSGAIATGPAPPAMVPTPRCQQTPRSSPGMGIRATQPPRGLPNSAALHYKQVQGLVLQQPEMLRVLGRARLGGPASVPLPNRSRPTPPAPDLCLATASAFLCHVFLPPRLGFFPSCNIIPGSGPSLSLLAAPHPPPSPCAIALRALRAQGRTHARKGGSRG